MTGCRALFLILAASGAAACLGIGDDTPSVTVWEAELVPALSYPDLSGQAAAVSRPDGTSVGISIQGAEPGAVHLWALRVGTCAQPGQQVGPDGDYPELDIGDSGIAEKETHLGPQLAYDGTYHIEVRLSATDPTRIACGHMVQP